ncbi:MAPEG family protein [Novosphingopyxis sp.]|uniref:MAPEG family protein n=1 Tax=Novosphingopyxis sp. TaxID=2709690 RepID=UPI003B58F9D1
MSLPFELTVLGLGCVLALVHIFSAIQLKTRQYGRAWNMGARDEKQPPLNDIAARVARAQANYFETFPIAIALLLAVPLAGHAGTLSAIGAALWLVARIIYLPLYWTGVKGWRTLAFLASVIGLLMLLAALFFRG